VYSCVPKHVVERGWWTPPDFTPDSPKVAAECDKG
jgi:hypothetical protein